MRLTPVWGTSPPFRRAERGFVLLIVVPGLVGARGRWEGLVLDKDPHSVFIEHCA
jgi:hypothetical protein